MTNAETLRRLRADASAKGLCNECRCRYPRTGLRTCDECLDRQALRKNANRASGRCRCGRRRARGLNNCRTCIDRDVDRKRNLWHGHKAAGICTYCRIAAPEPGHTGCRPCLDRKCERIKAFNARKSAS